MNEKIRPLNAIASDFFNYLGAHLPQQCASDEFYFLPRSEAAIQHLNRLDDLRPEKIQEYIQHVKGLLSEIEVHKQDHLEGEIDRLFFQQSMKSFVREFADARIWRSDPTLYVKLPLFATDQILSRSDDDPEPVKESLSTLFAQIPSFLNMGIKNLRHPSKIALKIALDMVQDAISFHSRDIRAFIEQRAGDHGELLEKNREVLEAWERYKTDLAGLELKDAFAIGEDDLSKILVTSLGYPKSSEDILEIARCAYQKTQEKLIELAGKIDTQKTWDIIISEQRPSISSQEAFFQLFKLEVQNLRRFFYSQNVISFPPGEKLAVLKTPTYLQSFRATASYRAPLTGNTGDQGLFYITPGNEDLDMISAHAPYLSAHETYPGHHILDHLRIHHPNPIRRQIESPLFYEGWACFAEQLLDKLGYIQDPRRQLIGLKRQLWRSLRAALDVELQTGKITLEQGAEKIKNLGFSSERAKRQIRRFAVTPGYQLCYFMGMYEIEQLYEKHSSRLGLSNFYDTLLGGGQIPFHLVEERLKARVKAEE